MSLPPPPKDVAPYARLATLLGFLAITAILYFGRDILIPLALAVLISFLLSPVVLWLERRGIKRVFAVVFVVLILIGLVGGIGYMLVGQFVEFVDNLPRYRKNIVTKIHAIRPSEENVFKRAEAAIADISKEVESQTTATATLTTQSEPADGATTGTTQTVATRSSVTTVSKTPQAPVPEETPDPEFHIPGITTIPGAGGPTSSALDMVDVKPQPNLQAHSMAMPVRVVEGPPNSWQTFVDIVGPFIAVLGNAGLVILIVIFFLLEREDLRDRVIRLAGQNKVRVTTEALEEAASRVSRYLLMQLIINVTYGIPVAIGLWLIGLPNAFLWGVMATILRFIPYIGPWLAALMPISLSLAVFDNWTAPLLIIGMFVVFELISNNLMEPILYGHSTGVSPVAIIVSAVFWTWLWGPVGLVLATPITVCLVVLGGHIPQMQFLRVLLGDEQVLDDDARIYNRLLSGATDEAIEVAEEYMDEHELSDLYDRVLVPALERAEIDRNDEMLSRDRYDKFLKGMEELMESIHDRLAEKEAARIKEEVKKAEANGEEPPPPADVVEAGQPVAQLPKRKIVCIPVSDPTDEMAAEMVKRLATSRECEVKVLAAGSLVSEFIGEVREFNADVVLLSSVPPFAVAHTRYLAKRLAAEFDDKKIYAGLWVGDNSVDRADQRLKAVGVEMIFTRVNDAAMHL